MIPQLVLAEASQLAARRFPAASGCDLSTSSSWRVSSSLRRSMTSRYKRKVFGLQSVPAHFYLGYHDTQEDDFKPFDAVSLDG
jgi:hypothetical protein